MWSFEIFVAGTRFLESEFRVVLINDLITELIRGQIS